MIADCDKCVKTPFCICSVLDIVVSRAKNICSSQVGITIEKTDCLCKRKSPKYPRALSSGRGSMKAALDTGYCKK